MNDKAAMIYTSGTTGTILQVQEINDEGKPKGVVHTHASLSAQCRSIAEAWKMRHDHLMHQLPLYHVHGFVNALLAVLSSGGRITFGHHLSPTQVLQHWSDAQGTPF